MFINRQFTTVYNGVATTPDEITPDNMVSEMVNCIPEISSGVRRRNGIEPLNDTAISPALTANSRNFIYQDSAGSGYMINVAGGTDNIRVFDGQMNELTADGSNVYLPDSVDSAEKQVSFAVVNGEIVVSSASQSPQMKHVLLDNSFDAEGEATVTIDSAKILFGSTALSAPAVAHGGVATWERWFALHRRSCGLFNLGVCYDNWFITDQVPALTTVVVDGQTILYRPSFDTLNTSYVIRGYNNEQGVILGHHTYNRVESFSRYKEGLYKKIASSLDTNEFNVVMEVDGVKVSRIQGGTGLDVSVDITFPTYSRAGYTYRPNYPDLGIYDGNNAVKHTYDATKTQYITNATGTTITPSSVSLPISVVTEGYKKTGYIWIKNDPTTSDKVNSVLTGLSDTGNEIFTTDIGSTDLSGDSSTLATNVASLITAYATTSGADANGDPVVVASYSPFLAVSLGSTIRVKISTNGATNNISTFKLTSYDGNGDTLASTWVAQIRDISFAPSKFPFYDAVVQVDSNPNDLFGAYFMQYKDNGWEEVADPSASNDVIEDTMPIKLRIDGDTFYTEYPTWENRVAGDVASNKDPSFIGSEIGDMTIYKDRLVFATGNSIVASEAGEYFNYFSTTATGIRDGDRIDVMPSTEASHIEYMVPLDDSLIMFTAKSQYKLAGGSIFSPASVNISQATSYDVDTSVRPISIGDSIYFLASKGDYTSVFRYRSKDAVANNVAEDVASHAYGYIPRGMQKMIGSAELESLFLLGEWDGTETTIYFYKYHDQGGKRIQSAWSKWTFGLEIFDILIIRRLMYVVTADTVYSLSIDSKGSFNFSDDGTDFESFVTIDNWLLPAGSGKRNSGDLTLKTIQVNSDNETAQITVDVANKRRKQVRNVDGKLILNKRAFVAGKANDVAISIKSVAGEAMQIDSIGYEGTYNDRSRRM